jgi:signal transduction histidine kinase
VRRRILLLVVGTTLLVVLAFAIPLTILISNVVGQNADRADTGLANQVGLYLRLYEPTDAQISSHLAALDRHGRQVSVTTPAGTVLGQAAPGGAGSVQPTDQDQGSAGYPGNPSGFGNADGSGGGDPHGGIGPQSQLTQVPGGRVAALAVPTSSGQYLVRIYQSDASVREGAYGWWALLAGGSIGLVVIGLVGGELVTRRLVRPLTHAAETANRITAGDVTARATVDGPREVAEVGAALNRLADRIDELIAEERETVADLSHRLRTPLTALRLDAEALRDPDEAERVGANVSALERTLTAVIRSARRPQREGRMPSADATAVVSERVEFWSALTDEQGRANEVVLPASPVLVRAAAEDLAAAVDALLENVIAHTPDGTPFAVRLTALDAGARLEVGDDGPGLPEDALIRGRSDRGSSGLGLDIVRRCAEGSGGSMQTGSTDRGGALITLVLGPP